MASRIEIGFKKGIRDALGEKIKKRIIEHLHLTVDEVKTVEVYTIDGDLGKGKLQQIARGPLSDPVIQDYTINRGLADGFDWMIEVGFRPGVTDNVGKTARESVELLLGEKVNGVYTSRQYIINGNISRRNTERIASDLLANELIERFEIVDGNEWNQEKGMAPYVPKVVGEESLRTEEIDLNVSDRKLLEISSKMILALNLSEMKIIQDYLADERVLKEREKTGLGKRITDAEIECLAQTWSEHCKHKIFNSLINYEDEHGTITVIDSLFNSYIKASTREIRDERGEDDFCLSV